MRGFIRSIFTFSLFLAFLNVAFCAGTEDCEHKSEIDSLSAISSPIATYMLWRHRLPKVKPANWVSTYRKKHDGFPPGELEEKIRRIGEIKAAIYKVLSEEENKTQAALLYSELIPLANALHIDNKDHVEYALYKIKSPWLHLTSGSGYNLETEQVPFFAAVDGIIAEGHKRIARRQKLAQEFFSQLQSSVSNVSKIAENSASFSALDFTDEKSPAVFLSSFLNSNEKKNLSALLDSDFLVYEPQKNAEGIVKSISALAAYALKIRKNKPSLSAEIENYLRFFLKDVLSSIFLSLAQSLDFYEREIKAITKHEQPPIDFDALLKARLKIKSFSSLAQLEKPSELNQLLLPLEDRLWDAGIRSAQEDYVKFLEAQQNNPRVLYDYGVNLTLFIHRSGLKGLYGPQLEEIETRLSTAAGFAELSSYSGSLSSALQEYANVNRRALVTLIQTTYNDILTSGKNWIEKENHRHSNAIQELTEVLNLLEKFKQQAAYHAVSQRTWFDQFVPKCMNLEKYLNTSAFTSLNKVLNKHWDTKYFNDHDEELNKTIQFIISHLRAQVPQFKKRKTELTNLLKLFNNPSPIRHTALSQKASVQAFVPAQKIAASADLGIATLPVVQSSTVLGEGSQAIVSEGTVAGIKVAVKKLRSPKFNDKFLENIRFHQAIQATAKSHHLVHLHGFEIDPKDGTVVAIFEHIDGMDLQKIIDSKKPMGLDFVANFLMQVIEGLRDVHPYGPFFELKPSNIIITKNNYVKLIDPGSGIASDPGILSEGLATRTSPLYTPLFSPPGETDLKDTTRDFFALGATLFMMVTGGEIPVGMDKPSDVLKRKHPDIVTQQGKALDQIDEIFSHTWRAKEGRYRNLEEIEKAVLELQARLKPESPTPLLIKRETRPSIDSQPEQTAQKAATEKSSDGFLVVVD